MRNALGSNRAEYGRKRLLQTHIAMRLIYGGMAAAEAMAEARRIGRGALPDMQAYWAELSARLPIRKEGAK